VLKMNSEMLKAYSYFSSDNIDLNRSLLEIAESGFMVKDGCFLLGKCMDADTNVSISNFPDKTGYECFINSVNIDDYVEENYLEQGICFVRNVFSRWNSVQGLPKLIAILSLDEFGLKVKFHAWRVGEHWLTDELEDYEESVLVVDSLEPAFSYSRTADKLHDGV
jgi:hypothetical protein